MGLKGRAGTLIIASFSFAVTVASLGAVEWYARSAQGYRLWSWSLEKGYFFEMDRLKVWNRRFYESKRPYFRDWPIPVELFKADKPTPRYLFKPNLAMTRRGNGLAPAGSGENIYWSSNSWGFRGVEFSVEKPRDVTRIVCLGASTTEGSQGDKETYPYFLQQELRRFFALPRIEVINAGHHGQGMEDLLEILRQRILPLKPDVVLFYEAANSIGFEEFLGNMPCKIGFPEGNCWLHLQPSWQRWLYERSAIFIMLSERLGWNSGKPPPMPHPFDDLSSKRSADYYKKVLRQIVRETLAHGSIVVLSSFVTLAHEGLEVAYEDNPLLFNDLYKKWYPFTPGELQRIYQRFNLQAAEVARELKVPYADVAAKFPQDSLYFPFDLIHFSPEGNRLLATIFASYLAKEVLPKIVKE